MSGASGGLPPYDIAIVSAAGLYPGATDLARFAEQLAAGVVQMRNAPPGRWIVPPEDAVGRNAVDQTPSARACFVDPIEFDPRGFAVAPELLGALDPLYQWVLHVGRKAWDGAQTRGLDPARVGVALAAIALPTDSSSAITRATHGRALVRRLREKLRSIGGDAAFLSDVAEGDPHPLNAHVVGLPAGLLAAALGLGGGACTLDAACASSLYALKIACDELTAGRVDAMLAGGVSRPEQLYTQMGFAQLQALSPTGTCRPFDAHANGLVVGEGCGLVVLKRAADARRDGDRILGIIRAIGVSNDMAGSLLAADREGQVRSMRAAYAQAGWRPTDVDLVECHGTGTPLGDAVEFGSLRTVWTEANDAAGVSGPITPIGSVKSNVGHLLTAAGIAGLHKVLAGMERGELLPSAGFEEPNPKLDLTGGPLRVLAKAEAWRRRTESTPRRAAVSGFGFGGVNAHVLVEEDLAATAVTTTIGRAVGDRAALKQSSLDVAIVGIAARIGDAGTEAFASAALRGESLARERPATRWRGGQRLGDSWGERGGYVNVLRVPRDEFRIPPAEILDTLPQQLLSLDVVAEALRDAGWSRGGGKHPRAGVVVGIGIDLNTSNYHLRWLLRPQARRWLAEMGVEATEAEFESWCAALRDAASPPLTAPRVLGALGSIAASRVAREFGFGGPSFAISATENSGLRAVEYAARALQRGEVDLAVAAAVDFQGDGRAAVTRASLAGVSAVVGEGPTDGAVAVVLRRADDEAEGRAYARIRGIGLASGPLGGTEHAVQLATARACAEAQADQQAIEWKERGATARVAGDCGAALGLAGFARAAISLGARLLPADGRRARCIAWIADAGAPRRALATQGGMDGTAIAVALEEASPRRGRFNAGAERPALFAFYGRDEAELATRVGELERLLANADVEPLESTAALWCARHAPSSGSDRALVLRAANHRELADRLRAAVRFLGAQNGLPPEGTFYASLPTAAESLAFVYPGSGNHYVGMGGPLALAFPEVVSGLERQTPTLRTQISPQRIWEAWASGRATEIAAAQASLDADPRAVIQAQVSHGILVTAILRGLGVTPAGAIGYSLGETTSLCALGVWNDWTALLRRLEESPLFATQLAGTCTIADALSETPAPGQPAFEIRVLRAEAGSIERALAGSNEPVRLLIRNAPGECVVGGRPAAIARLVHRLDCDTVLVRGASLVHCDLVAPVADEYRRFHDLPTNDVPNVRFYSAADAKAYVPTRAAAAESITAQAVHGFDFGAVIRAAYADGVRTFVEIGPGSSCTRMIGRILEGQPHRAIAATPSVNGEVSGVLDVLAELVAQRIVPDLRGLYADNIHHGERASRDRVAMVEVPLGGPTFDPPLPPLGAGRRSPALPSEVGMRSDMSVLRGYSPELPMLVAGANAAAAGAHARYLSGAAVALHDIASLTARQTELLQMLANGGPAGRAVSGFAAGAATSTVAAASSAPPVLEPPRSFDRAACMEFAVGRVRDVLGPAFAVVDEFPVRVRLPDEPLMLVDRILSVEGTPRSLMSGRIVTEHDVLGGAWYLDADRAPVCISVEAGQADLFLSSFLGIDHAVRGRRAYRLLDATVKFHRGLPRPGETIRYDIRIDKFVRQGDAYLFFFRFEGTIDGAPLITMNNGCAGFFTNEEIENSGGIILTDADRAPQAGRRTGGYEDLPPAADHDDASERYSDAQVEALRRGDLAGCFGEAFAALPLAAPMRLPGGRMRLLHRVAELSARGGRFGLGRIVAEADVQPDDWFLTCHFVDDMVMPGTLMYECCAHTLRVLLMRQGWVGEASEVAFEPVKGVPAKLKCRGPVTTATKRVTYQVDIKEIGYGPTPYVIADALMCGDGRPIVTFTDMSLQFTGLSRERLERIWSVDSGRDVEIQVSREPRATAEPIGDAAISDGPRPALFTKEQILAFSNGNPSECFGQLYAPFDRERRIARLPGPPYQVMDRITRIEGPRPNEARPSGWIEAQYDVPRDAWYFGANRQRSMPFAVLLEIALQPCGWLAAYSGAALRSKVDLHFRNLGGTATQLAEVFADAGTLTVRVRMTDVSDVAGMILQDFDMQVWQGRRCVYSGVTKFGFFTTQSLAQQVGLRDAAKRAWRTPADESARIELPRVAPLLPSDVPGRDAGFDTLATPGRAWQMLDGIEAFDRQGGAHGLGRLRGWKQVDPAEWFFAAHFHQDPVVPGSLGLESLLQLLRFAAGDFWPELAKTHRLAPLLNVPHSWQYRGQVIPKNRRVTTEATITGRGDGPRPHLRADGLLSVDGLYIYEMQNFGVRLTPRDE